MFWRYEGRGSSRKGVDSIVNERILVGGFIMSFVVVNCFGGVSTRTAQKVGLLVRRILGLRKFLRETHILPCNMIIRQARSLLNSLIILPSAFPKVVGNPTLPIGIRTATKRAGGFKAGSSDSAGKRRGVKVGGGSFTFHRHH